MTYCNPYLSHLTADPDLVAPIGTKLLVEVFERPEVTGGGIHLNMNHSYEASDRGTVVAVGEEVSDIKPGDRVLYPWRKGDDFVVDGKHWLFIEKEHVLGFITGNEGPRW